MQLVYIPKERLKILSENKATLERMCKAGNCKLFIENGEAVRIEGSAFDEFVARNIVHAFGRGFDPDTACKLANSDYYFTAIDLEQIFGNEKRIRQVKARIIGEDGRTKKYIEQVSATKISVYGNTVGFIGKVENIREAEVAVNTLIDGGTHRLAYNKMEAEHRKNTQAAKDARF
jgi:ribosomal RNA assembly protein